MIKGIQEVRQQPTSQATARVLGVLAYRHALRVVWELRAGALNFRQLQAACGGISPSVLQSRIRELRALGLIEKITGLGYRLTVDGEGLFTILAPLRHWAGSLKSLDFKE